MVQNNFDDGINILKNDEYFNPIINSMDVPIFPKESDYFQSLIKFIIYQQLSIKAARKIYMRFLSLFIVLLFLILLFRMSGKTVILLNP